MIFLCIVLFLFFVIFSLRYNWWRKPKSYDKPRVLMYHSISDHKGEKWDKLRVKPKDFEKQMLWLKKNGFKTYFVSELSVMQNTPKKAVCITFDDGFKDNFTNAFKILKKFDFKATIYLVPNQITNHWDEKHTKFISDMLNIDEISKMVKSGLIEFGSHTLTHANLGLISKEKAKFEIENSKIEVQNLTGQICKSFAYPYGKFDDELKALVKLADYTDAVVVKRGLYNKSDKFDIRRIGILGTESFFDFWLKFTRVRNKF